MTCAVAVPTVAREVGRLLGRMGWAVRRRDSGRAIEFAAEGPAAERGVKVRVSPGEDRVLTSVLRVPCTRLEVELRGGHGLGRCIGSGGQAHMR